MTELPIDPPEASVEASRPRRGRPPNGTREPTRESSRNGEYVGRGGEVLSRRRTDVADPYMIPDNLKESEWDYQWNTVTVVGNNEVAMPIDNMMYDNGWRPVPADRPGFAKRFGVPSKGNAIIVGGLRLDERPKAMSEAAKEDEYRRATGQMRDRDAALTGGKAALRNALEGNDMPMTQGYRGRRTNTRLGIDQEAPRPNYQYATGDE
jgi:hypothetical protein